MRDDLERLLRAADVPSPERAEQLWSEYRAGGPGAEAAFRTLLAWHGLALYRRIWGFVRSDAADDVFQDVLAKWHRARKSLATFDHALRWLRTVAVRECVDAHRRTVRRTAREARRTVAPAGPAPHTDRAELQEVLAVALAKLRAEHREAVALVFFEGLDKQDAARVLGVNRDTLAKRLAEALDRLRVLLPAPAVAVATGAAVESALASGPPPLAPARLGDLASLALARAATAGPTVGKASAAVLVGLALGGVAVGGWAMTREPRPEPEPPVITRLPDPPPETLQERNVRVFRDTAGPRITAALRRLTLGEGGSVAVTAVEAHGTCVVCRAEVRHGPPFTHTSRVRLAVNLHTRQQDLRLDLWGTGGRMQPLYAKRPITLWENGPTVPLADVAELAAALDAVPDDPRSAAEADRDAAELERAAQPYLGDWYRRGGPGRAATVRWVAGHDHPLRVHYATGEVFYFGLDHLRLVRLDGLDLHSSRVVLSADGTRLDFPDAGDWWTRKPDR